GAGRTSVPSLEEEIDFLADVLARQEAPHPHQLRDGKPRSKCLSLTSTTLCSSAADPAAARPCTPGWFALQSCPGAAQLTAMPSPAATLVPGRLIVVCTVAGISALIVAAVCWCRLQKEVRLAQKADYAAQRAASPLPYDKISPGDKTLAQSAQMYHYQHQKQQMLSMEKHKEEPKLPDSASSDEENEDGDFTVYECPGLAP
ncbi:Neural proliferation differentiation and control protein 1, partial [Phalacrocorax carbo]